MIQMSTPRHRTFCEVIDQKLLVEMLATIHSPFWASSPTMTLLMVRNFEAKRRRDVVLRLRGFCCNVHSVGQSFGPSISAWPSMKEPGVFTLGHRSP